MSRTVGDVITAVRGIVQDERTPYRYSNAAIAAYVSEAVSEARRVRPDLFLTTWRQAITFYTAADTATVIPLPDFLFPQVVNYVAGRTDLREDEFSQDGRAMALIGAFGVALKGNPA